MRSTGVGTRREEGSTFGTRSGSFLIVFFAEFLLVLGFKGCYSITNSRDKRYHCFKILYTVQPYRIMRRANLHGPVYFMEIEKLLIRQDFYFYF